VKATVLLQVAGKKGKDIKNKARKKKDLRMGRVRGRFPEEGTLAARASLIPMEVKKRDARPQIPGHKRFQGRNAWQVKSRRGRIGEDRVRFSPRKKSGEPLKKKSEGGKVTNAASQTAAGRRKQKGTYQGREAGDR